MRCRLCEEVKATLCVILLNNAYSLHLSQRVDEERGGPFISEFTEVLRASWEREGDSEREGSKKSLSNYLQL